MRRSPTRRLKGACSVSVCASCPTFDSIPQQFSLTLPSSHTKASLALVRETLACLVFFALDHAQRRLPPAARVRNVTTKCAAGTREFSPTQALLQAGKGGHRAPRSCGQVHTRGLRCRCHRNWGQPGPKPTGAQRTRAAQRARKEHTKTSERFRRASAREAANATHTRDGTSSPTQRGPCGRVRGQVVAVPCCVCRKAKALPWLHRAGQQRAMAPHGRRLCCNSQARTAQHAAHSQSQGPVRVLTPAHATSGAGLPTMMEIGSMFRFCGQEFCFLRLESGCISSVSSL